MNIAIIPARGGSKRIPGKNIRLFNGKPLIQHSIETAADSGLFERIVVSTDSEDIKDAAVSCGAEVPFIRPAELADDHSTTGEVMKHAVAWLRDHDADPDLICCIYPTAPLMSGADLSLAHDTLLRHADASYCFAACPYPYPIQRAFRITENNRVDMLHPEHLTTRSQDLEEVFHDAGQFYWGRPEAFLSMTPMFSKQAIPHLLPAYRVVDLDTEDDWQRAALLHTALNAGTPPA